MSLLNSRRPRPVDNHLSRYRSRAEADTISSGKYPVSRPLYIYVKKAHAGVIPGITEYLAEFTSARASGPDGYLSDKGLIPMPDQEQTQYRNVATNLTPLTM